MIVTTTPRDVPWDVVATTLQRGAWACFAPEDATDQVGRKAAKVGRRVGVRIQALWRDGRVFAIPVVRGSCASRRQVPPEVEWQRDVDAVADLIQTVRAQAIALACEGVPTP